MRRNSSTAGGGALSPPNSSRARTNSLARRSLAGAFIGLSLVACSAVQTTEPGTVGVQRTQYMMIPASELDSAAAVAYREELEQARRSGELNRDASQLRRVRTIAGRLVPHTAVFRPDAPGWSWEVNVRQSEEVNAYCMPGGKIMVYSGLIERLEASDAELAAVIGHEMAHALREHSRERISREYAQQLALAGVATVAGAGDRVLELANIVSTVTFQLPHSREQEAEADRIGLELMARAGFDPRASLSLWQKMRRVGGTRGPEFLSTHPSGATRLDDLRKLIPSVLPLYETARRAN